MTSAKPDRTSWLIPTGLIALSLIPALAGSARLAELAGGPQNMPDSERLASAPVPVVIHIIAVTVYAMLGAFQFAPRFRRRRIGWHRAAGRLLVLCGLAVALTGLWLTLFLERAAIDGTVLTGIRVVVGVAMASFIVLGLAAVLRRDIAGHRAWMIRGYAIGMGAGTQAFTQLPWIVFVGPLDELSKTVLMAAAWIINIVVAEWIIRRRPVRPAVRGSGAPRRSAIRREQPVLIPRALDGAVVGHDDALPLEQIAHLR